MAGRKEILENLRIRFPDAKVSVKKATERAAAGVAYVATVKHAQTSARDIPKIMILSFDSSGNEIQKTNS